jgi:hypothetical protein
VLQIEENIYNLYIFWCSIAINYTTMHGVEHIPRFYSVSQLCILKQKFSHRSGRLCFIDDVFRNTENTQKCILLSILFR